MEQQLNNYGTLQVTMIIKIFVINLVCAGLVATYKPLSSIFGCICLYCDYLVYKNTKHQTDKLDKLFERLQHTAE